MHEIAIFRQNLFRISEPFISQQAQQLRRYKPVYVGRLRFGDPPAMSKVLALQDQGEWRRWPLIAWQVVTRDPGPYQRLLGERQPALIHAHFGTDGVYALALATRLRVPLITTFHGFDATLSTASLLCSPAWANYPLFRRRLARQGALFLCVSSFIRDRVLAMGFPAERTRVHYTGVDCQIIPMRDVREETSTILHVARLVEMKGTQYLIRAFADVIHKHPAARLIVIGDGPLGRTLKKLAKSLVPNGQIRFLGALPHDDVMLWMRKAAMLVLPSIRTRSGRVEGLGMVLLEAAATGVPVVACRVGGIPEGVIDGQTGFLVPDRDAQALSRRIVELLDAPELRERMGAKGRAFVEQHFDSRQQGAVLEALYDEVVSAPSKQGPGTNVSPSNS